MHPNYYEGVLQLRNPNQAVVSFVEKAIKRERKVSVAKVVEFESGLDYYLSSNKFLRKLGKRLALAFPGQLKESKRIFTKSRQTQKEVYRGTVCFRLVDVKVGDVVKVRREKVKVVKLDAKRLYGRLVASNKKVTASYSDIDK
ncbi:TPA: hypothetical protein HA361_07245 [Candidatus Woesearchaeota archaeon]|nr:hypothetical protein [Candidatus Woesearchaeota archaeon]HII69439.1 hypothetical protein [Candidatus Woesearchaeota archaeon]